MRFRLSLVALLCSGGAFAQVVAGGDLQRFTPSGTPYTGFAAAAGELLDPGAWAIGAHVNYERNPLVYLVDGQRTAASIRNNTTLQLHGVVGIFERLELSLGVPVVLHQDGGDPLFGGGPSTAIGDLRLRPRIQILQQWRNGIALTLSPTLTVPLSRSNSFNSEGSVRFLPEAGVSWRGDRWFYSADALFRWRAAQSPIDHALVGRELELVAAVGRTISRNVELILEMTGGVALETSSLGAKGNPLEGLTGLRFRLGDSWTLDLEGGMGILSAPGVPDYRAVAGLTYGEGRPRTNDTCTRHDATGTYSVRMLGHDTDGDGIDDACDLCPGQAGVAPDGCPAVAVCLPPPAPAAPIKIVPVQTRRKVVALPIEFDFDSDEVRPASLPLIKEMVDELARLPSMMICRVEGHTDHIGDDEYNLDLSERRAASVVREMVKMGVDEKRLSSRGHGYRRPVADKTDQGRQKNRRVEFIFSLPDDAGEPQP